MTRALEAVGGAEDMAHGAVEKNGGERLKARAAVLLTLEVGSGCCWVRLGMWMST